MVDVTVVKVLVEESFVVVLLVTEVLVPVEMIPTVERV